ncbi:MAG: matrixin family metalloprotease [Acidimicrobiales bacterium]
MSLSVQVDQREFVVDPGESVSGEVVVRNGGLAPVVVGLQVAGPAAPWAWVVPPEVSVEPGGEATARFGFRVPRGPRPPAGRLAFQVRAGSTPNGAGADPVDGVLTVKPYRDLSVSLGPARSEGQDGPQRHRVTVANEGNEEVRATLAATSPDPGLAVAVEPATVVLAPGAREVGSVTVGAVATSGPDDLRPVFTVTATPGDGPAAVVRSAPLRETRSGPAPDGRRTRRRPAVLAAVASLVVAAVVLRLTVLAPAGGNRVSAGSAPTTVAIDEAGTEDPDCLAAGHVDRKVTGLTPADIPLLPADYSFFALRDDGCTPVRWNPCEPVHYVINPALAPPTGVADVREAFARLGAVTGINYVDDGMTDEVGNRRGRARYQPERYGQRWVPILVYWQNSDERESDTQIVGGGFPARVGDTYVTGVLFLNAAAVTDFTTNTPVQGGFGPDPGGVGAIGPTGVTWGRVILHELGHLTGLSHVRDPTQLMYPETAEHTTRPTLFSDNDRAGLGHLGVDAGCLPTPPPAP